MMRKIALCFVCMSCLWNANAARRNGFAIVVDAKTHEEAKAEIDSYAKAIDEKEDLQPVVVIDKWGTPDSIRDELARLYSRPENPIEGAVFVGDIPIPMIRDAQHLTSAFKMDQERFDRKESSVPSDRFYDDFDLQFKPLDRDEEKPSLFYYSLTPESKQFLSPDIYTGRIKANDGGGTSRYEKIRAFLRKAVACKYENNAADQILFFSGNGYVSESVVARIDEKVSLLENFPNTKFHANGIEYIDHKRDAAIKGRLKAEMQRPDLDIAILHHHGDAEIQYMNGIPETSNTAEVVENIKVYLRETLRHAKEKGKDVDSIKTVLGERYGGLPESWFEGAFDTAVIAKDSIFERSLDLHIDEFADYRPNARFVLLDACYNGAFNNDKYIAGAHIFNEGKTVAVMGNSVNVLQDKWHDRYVGMLGLGMFAGRMAQLNPFLEGHFFGDPTFHFAATDGRYPDINKLLSSKSESFWKKQLKSEFPALRAMALRRLADTGENYSGLFLDTYKASNSFVVRMEALALLSACNDGNFIECLSLAVNDSYELVQRFAINFIAKSGDLRLAPALISAAVKNNTSERCEFNVKMALALFPEETLMDEFEKQFGEISYYSDKQKVHGQIAEAIKVNAGKWKDEVRAVYDDSSSVKRKIFGIRILRNNMMHEEVPRLLDYVVKAPDDTVKTILWEALGWFSMSYRREEIAEAALAASQNPQFAKEVRGEALKTYNRIKKTKAKSSK